MLGASDLDIEEDMCTFLGAICVYYVGTEHNIDIADISPQS